MTSSKHDKGDSPFLDDLERDPGIGQSKGTPAGGDRPQIIEGENTTEGDVDNDSTVFGGVPQGEQGRTNK